MFRNSSYLHILQSTKRVNSQWFTKFSSRGSPKVIGFKEKPAVDEIHDYIGPPDKNSNIRSTVRRIPKNETSLQIELRLRRSEVEKWNHDFWANHNKRFYDEKEEYIKKMQKPNEDSVGPDSMSVFYKEFLDKNRRMHTLYNMSWYLKNFELLIMAAQVNAESFIKKFRRTPKDLN